MSSTIAPLLPAPLHALALIFVCVESSHVISLVFPVAEHTSPPVPSPKAVADPAAILQSKLVRAVPAAAVFQHTQRLSRSVVNSMVPPAWTVGASSFGTTPIAAPASLTRHAAVMLQRSNHDVPGSAPRRDPGTIRTDILPFRIARRALASASQRRSPPHRTRTRCARTFFPTVGALQKPTVGKKQQLRSQTTEVEQTQGIDASAHKRRTTTRTAPELTQSIKFARCKHVFFLSSFLSAPLPFSLLPPRNSYGSYHFRIVFLNYIRIVFFPGPRAAK